MVLIVFVIVVVFIAVIVIIAVYDCDLVFVVFMVVSLVELFLFWLALWL